MVFRNASATCCTVLLAIVSCFTAASCAKNEQPYAPDNTGQQSTASSQRNGAGMHSGSGTTSGALPVIPPRSSSSGGGSGSSGGMPSNNSGQSGQGVCDGDCASSDQCGTGQGCMQFAAGKKCGPSECLSCKRGCVFDLRTCKFTRCLADTPDNSPDTMGECTPRECTGCQGFCDCDLRTCGFDTCYLAAGATSDPFYCGHQF
jgi:hypothetical protein